MDIKIRKSTTGDSKPYQKLCFDVYRETYVYPELGFDESLLSKEIFFNEATTKYFKDLMDPAPSKASFVAELDDDIVGGIAVYEYSDSCVISGYYVQTGMQGKGIGKKLWEHAEKFIDGRTAKLTVHAHSWRTVNSYFRKGFIIDPNNPRDVAHWPEWPESKKFLMYCMIRPGELVQKSLPKEAESANLERAKLYTDGGSRGNPGPSAGGYVILDMEDNVVKGNGKYLGITTNNQAEYHSLKGGVEKAIQMGIRELDVYMDSLLVINQMKGIFKIRNRDLWPIHDAIKSLLPRFKKITFTHIPRELNGLADAEVNKTLDAQG